MSDAAASVFGFVLTHHAVCRDGGAGREHHEVAGDKPGRVDVAPLAISFDLKATRGKAENGHERERERSDQHVVA